MIKEILDFLGSSFIRRPRMLEECEKAEKFAKEVMEIIPEDLDDYKSGMATFIKYFREYEFSKEVRTRLAEPFQEYFWINGLDSVLYGNGLPHELSYYKGHTPERIILLALREYLLKYYTTAIIEHCREQVLPTPNVRWGSYDFRRLRRIAGVKVLR